MEINVETLIEDLKNLKLKHHVEDDDNWYSCPCSGQCIQPAYDLEEYQPKASDCNCAAGVINTKIDTIISKLKPTNVTQK